MARRIVILQGPLTSLFRRDEKRPMFEADEQLVIYLSEIGEWADAIVLSVWRKDHRRAQELVRRVGAVRSRIAVVSTDDPGRPANAIGQVHDNRFRQYLSTWRGLQAIGRPEEDDLAIKARSDQYLPLRPLLDEFETRVSSESRERQLMFPFAFGHELYSLGDFFVVGRARALASYFAFLVNQHWTPVGSPSVHVDIAQKYLLWRRSTGDGNPTVMVNPHVPAGHAASRGRWLRVPECVVDSWASALESEMLLSDSRWLENSLWRGEGMERYRAKGFLFAEDVWRKDLAALITRSMTRRVGDVSQPLSATVFARAWPLADIDSRDSIPQGRQRAKLVWKLRQWCLRL